MPIRFQRGGAYQSDLASVRRAIRANGANTVLLPIPVGSPLAPGRQVTLFVNLAFQPNSALPQPNASLYTLGFTGAGGQAFAFTLNPAAPIGVPGSLPIAADGSYASLGFGVNPLPTIGDQSLADAIQAVSGFAGGALPANVATGLARLLIAVNEAIRLDAVADGIDAVLGATEAYQPPGDVIHAWGGRMIGR